MSRVDFDTIHKMVTGELERIEIDQDQSIKRAEQSVVLLRSALDQLRQAVIATAFSPEAEEITFFKRQKPLLESRLIYFSKVHQVEAGWPGGSHDAQLLYLRQHLSEIDAFHAQYPEFHNYIRTEASFLDQLYFVRGRQDPLFLMGNDWLHEDPGFTTGYDQLIARMLANSDLVIFISKAVERLQTGGEDQEAEGASRSRVNGFAQTPYRGQEVYVFLKSLIDAQGVVNHTYKSFFELIGAGIANMHQKSFVPSSLLKYSDKVDPETRENVKRLLQKMIRNIDSY